MYRDPLVMRHNVRSRLKCYKGAMTGPQVYHQVWQVLVVLGGLYSLWLIAVLHPAAGFTQYEEQAVSSLPPKVCR